MTRGNHVQSLTAIGLMSGTSMDGVDVALIETDGEGQVRQGPSGFRPYAPDERDLLRAALADAVGLDDRSRRPGRLAEAEALVTRAHAEAVESFLAAQALAASSVDVVGFHGQTVLHRPEKRLTVQIGDGPSLAGRLGLRVVHDFRAADVAAGGQGAPFVPIYHAALVRAARAAGVLPAGAVAVLNLGGVANATVVDRSGAPMACDTGPANALVDDLMLARTGRAMDEGGAVAAQGRVDDTVLARLLAHPFFEEMPPKSLDRNDFSRNLVESLATADAAATLTAFSAAGVAALVRHLPEAPELWIASGGGARNPTLLRMLAEHIGAPVVTADSLGWSADAMEAQAFAYLAVRSLKGLPLSFPATTGVPEPMPGGVLSVAA
jgi:anhydro-N-acetylmuramic acid kinase